KQTGKYDEAVAAFNRFIADNPKTYKVAKKRALVEIKGCEMATKSMMDPQAVTVKNAGPNVNSSYTESAPYPLGDTSLLFSTMRQNDLVEVDKKKRADYMARFMTSTKQKYTEEVDSFQWPMKFMDGEFNSGKEHASNGSY